MKTYICPTCDGAGYRDVYYNEYDMYEVECGPCEGSGEIFEEDFGKVYGDEADKMLEKAIEADMEFSKHEK